MYIPANPGNDVRLLRQRIYDVLRCYSPEKLTASEIAYALNTEQFGEVVTPNQVAYAIRYYALQCKHFAVYPVNGEVRYSVYAIDPPFNAWAD